MSIHIRWKPDQLTGDRLIALAQRRGEYPEKIVTEAVSLYLETEIMKPFEEGVDPLVGLFLGSPYLGNQSEEILQQEIREPSGWTWKETSS